MNPCICLGFALMNWSLVATAPKLSPKILDTSATLIYFFIAKYHKSLTTEAKYSNNATL